MIAFARRLLLAAGYRRLMLRLGRRPARTVYALVRTYRDGVTPPAFGFVFRHRWWASAEDLTSERARAWRVLCAIYRKRGVRLVLAAGRLGDTGHG